METPVTGETMRAVMRRVPSPVTVVTAAGAGGQRGITIGSFTSVALEPPLISFNVHRKAQAHDTLAEAGRFAVHILSSRQALLAEHFAVPDRTSAEQFASIAYHVDAHGTPILDDVLAVIHCRPYAAFEVADETIFVGEVTDVEEGHGEPLAYYRSTYHEVGSRAGSSPFAPVKRASSEAPS